MGRLNYHLVEWAPSMPNMAVVVDGQEWAMNETHPCLAGVWTGGLMTADTEKSECLTGFFRLR